MKKLHIADTDQIRSGDVTDVYFLRAEKILKARHCVKNVCMEVFLKSFPDTRYTWGVFAGLQEVCILLEGRPVTIHSIPEGSLFRTNTPVMNIEGNYLDFGELETAVLGCLCQASGIATKAARCKVACGDKGLVSFGARRMHPAIAPMVERAAFIGGCDGVATLASARLIDEKPVGTMPHTLILQIGDTVEAALAFDEIIDPGVPRIVLIDTFQDEKFEAIRVAQELKDRLSGVRLDTPASRRGNFRTILKEVRWELDTRGFDQVKLYVSGGLDTDDIINLADTADAFGVGTQISSAATLDYSLDIVEIEGEPVAKRGKCSGRKDLLRCRRCMKDYVVPYGEHRACDCTGELSSVFVKVMENGKLVSDFLSARQIRAHCLDEVAAIQKDIPPKIFLGLV